MFVPKALPTARPTFAWVARLEARGCRLALRADAGASVFMCEVDRDAMGVVRAAHQGIGIALADVVDPVEVGCCSAKRLLLLGDAVTLLGGLDVLVDHAGIFEEGARSAEYVATILRVAKSSDLPVGISFQTKLVITSGPTSRLGSGA
jgi:hypothetical protein